MTSFGERGDSFGERVRAGIAAHGRMCVGIDPHVALLQAWGLDASAEGAREFGLRVVEAAAGRIAIVKPQVSFFERYGSAGFAALGVGTLEGTFDLALRSGKGVFVLAATSNPDAFTAQRARLGSGETVSGAIVREVSERSARTTPEGEWASLGFVIGGTVEWADAGLRPFAPVAPLLGPGFGHQGAEPEHVLSRFGEMAPAVIASESRSILAAGPDRLAARISERALLYRGDRHA